MQELPWYMFSADNKSSKMLNRLYFVHDFLKGLCKMNNFQYINIDCLSFFLKKGTMVCFSLRRGTICSFVRAETGGLQQYERCSLKEYLYIRPGQRQDRREENQVSVLTKRHNLVYL